MNAITSKRLAATAVLLAAPVLASCGVNFDAQTDQVYQPAEGVNDRDGIVDVLNALVISGGDGSGRFIAGLANNSDVDEMLTGVVGVDVDQSLDITLEEGDYVVPAEGFLQLADDDAGMVVVTGEQVIKGGFVRVQLSFSDAEPVEVNVPVVPPGTDYDEVLLPESGIGAEVTSDEGSESAGG